MEKKDEEQEEESGGRGGRGRSPAKEVRGRSPQKEIISLSPSKSESSIVSPFFKKSEYLQKNDLPLLFWWLHTYGMSYLILKVQF